MLQFLNVGKGEATRRIAVLVRPGLGPTVFWLGGFRSDMRATKAEALDRWAERSGRAFVRFDYSGHGESGGAFEEGTVSRWLDDTLAVVDAFGRGPFVLVGSSMGGWLALLATRALLTRNPSSGPSGLVLIAPAVDFTERLMWETFPPDVQRTVLETGIYL